MQKIHNMIFKNLDFQKEDVNSFFVDKKYKESILPKNCIFLDIETVSGYATFEEMPKILQERWEVKVNNWIQYSESSKAKILDAIFTEFENSQEKDFDQNILFNLYTKYRTDNAKNRYKEMAALYPEYGKIICISVGYFKNEEFQIVSFVGEELDLLKNFQFGINKIYERLRKSNSNQPNGAQDVYLVGHNLSFFDIPYITKRMNINGLLTPYFLHQPFTEPWNKKLIDTATEWRVGNITGDATLETICAVLNIKSPKNGEVNGSNMTEYYYSNIMSIEEIVSYCESDVEATYKIFNHLQNLKTFNL